MNQVNKSNFKSNIMNIEKVAKLLNIKINESFKIQFYGHKQPYKEILYKLTKDGLMHCPKNNKYWIKSNALEGLILGKHQICK